MERLSIIIPVLNEAGIIEDALYALRPLRARGHEVIVVDGGGGDGTLERACALADRVLVAPRGRAHRIRVPAGSRARHSRGWPSPRPGASGSIARPSRGHMNGIMWLHGGWP